MSKNLDSSLAPYISQITSKRSHLQTLSRSQPSHSSPRIPLGPGHQGPSQDCLQVPWFLPLLVPDNLDYSGHGSQSGPLLSFLFFSGSQPVVTNVPNTLWWFLSSTGTSDSYTSLWDALTSSHLFSHYFTLVILARSRASSTPCVLCPQASTPPIPSSRELCSSILTWLKASGLVPPYKPSPIFHLTPLGLLSFPALVSKQRQVPHDVTHISTNC